MCSKTYNNIYFSVIIEYYLLWKQAVMTNKLKIILFAPTL